MSLTTLSRPQNLKVPAGPNVTARVSHRLQGHKSAVSDSVTLTLVSVADYDATVTGAVLFTTVEDVTGVFEGSSKSITITGTTSYNNPYTAFPVAGQPNQFYVIETYVDEDVSSGEAAVNGVAGIFSLSGSGAVLAIDGPNGAYTVEAAVNTIYDSDGHLDVDASTWIAIATITVAATPGSQVLYIEAPYPYLRVITAAPTTYDAYVWLRS